MFWLERKNCVFAENNSRLLNLRSIRYSSESALGILAIGPEHGSHKRYVDRIMPVGVGIRRMLIMITKYFSLT